MLSFKIKLALTIAVLALSLPLPAFALQLPVSGNELASMANLSAQAYAVKNIKTGQVLISKNSDMPWPPASLTKLVTALVVLDTKPKLAKTVAITRQDQNLGACGAGGACILAKPGVKFTIDGLFHALLLPSANNAASALARSTGLSAEEFAKRMNEKAASLGATHSHFNEPTGMDPANVTTAGDYVNIIQAAFANNYLRNIAGLQTYYLRSANNWRYSQTIKNTNKLLADADIKVIGAKTGYLDESQYNFASLLRASGQEFAVVVLGEQHLYTAFAETKLLSGLAQEAQALAMLLRQPGMLFGMNPLLTIN
ncbi:MAG: serine hydrolase [Patescibacteria group bacterium]|nr:serine hydrolase [Patescibacteria group bacterium]